MRDWKSQGGLPVRQVTPGGPADRAGLSEGTILVEANGRPLRNFLDWEAVKLDLRVGDVVTVTVKDGARNVTRRLVTGDLPTVRAAKVTVMQGLQLVTLTPAIRGERGVRSERGALVFRLTDEVRSATGLAAGGINRSPVTSAEQVASLIEAIRPRQTFRVYFERDGQIAFTDLAFR